MSEEYKYKQINGDLEIGIMNQGFGYEEISLQEAITFLNDKEKEIQKLKEEKEDLVNFIKENEMYESLQEWWSAD